MPTPGQSISVIAGRIGLYHFLVACSAILLDRVLRVGACHASPIGALAQLAETPGLAIDHWQWPTVLDPTLQACIAISHVVWLVCVNSLIYGLAAALVMHTVRRFRS